MSSLRVGIIGMGQMGRLHARVLKGIEGVEIAAVCTRNKDIAERAAGELGARGFTDYRDLLTMDLDAVWVTTPDFAHRDIACAVLEAGKHLFLEKVLATTLQDAKDILAAAESHPELVAMVGYPLRFAPQYRRMKEISRDAGPPALAWSIRTHFLDEKQSAYDKYRGDFYRPPAWYFDEARARGPVYSHASHDYDLLRWLCGEVESVFAYGGRYLVKGGDVDDGFVVSLRFKSGATATVSTPWVTRVEYDFVGIAYEKLTVVWTNKELRVRREEGPEEYITFCVDDMWEAMERHFLHCVRTGEKPLISVADGFEAQRIAEAAWRALHERREVYLT